MNKEYMILSDNEVLVIDENGHAIKRKIKNDNIHDELLLENDLEKINKTIVNLEKAIHHDEEINENKDGKIGFVIFNLIVMLLAYGIGRLIVPTDIIYVMIGFAGGIFSLDAAVTVAYRERKKQINGNKKALELAYQLKTELEQKLSDIKEKSNDKEMINVIGYKKTNAKINETVVLENTTHFCEEATRRLQEYYTAGYEEIGPVLVKKKIPPRNTGNK